MSFQLLRNSFVVGSISTSIGGFILLFTPYSNFSQFLMGAGVGALGASNLAIQSSQKIAAQKNKKLTAQIEKMKDDTAHFAKLLTAKHEELTRLADDRNHMAELASQLGDAVEALKDDLAATKVKLNSTRDINFTAAIATLRESLNEVVTQVNHLIPFLSKKYPELKTDWVTLTNQFNGEVNQLSAQIGVISDSPGLTNEELIAACLACQHEIILKGSSIKAKLYKAATDHLQRQLYNVIPVDEHNAKLQQVKEYYSGNLKAIQNEFSQVADGVISAYKQDFSEVVNDGLSQSQELEQLQHEIVNLNRKLQELSKPLRFPGLTEQARVGNAIIDYYSRLGYVLDAIDWQSNETGYRLLFHTSRNGSRFISTDLLNEGDNPQKLKEVSAALNTPKFEQSDRASYFYLNIESRKPEKKQLTIEDIRRLIEPSSKFGDVVRRYHESKPTLRVMTRTGGGKGIAVKNLLQNYVNNFEGWEIWLSDPQHGSFEDYWQCPKVATNPTEAHRILDVFVSEFQNRKDGTSTNADVPVIGVFDETDKTFDKKQKGAIAQIWTEIRHRKLKLVLIGQSGEVGKNGWTWDEMNNCSLMFIGDAIGTAIKHADDMGWSSEMKAKIPTIYQKVSDWMNATNQDLPVKNHYRLGLLVDGMRFDFVEIPPALEGEIEDNKSWLVSHPWQSKAIKEGLAVACSHCGSTNVKRNGRSGDRQRYRCGDCGKSFTKERAKAPSF